MTYQSDRIGTDSIDIRSVVLAAPPAGTWLPCTHDFVVSSSQHDLARGRCPEDTRGGFYPVLSRDAAPNSVDPSTHKLVPVPSVEAPSDVMRLEAMPHSYKEGIAAQKAPRGAHLSDAMKVGLR